MKVSPNQFILPGKRRKREEFFLYKWSYTFLLQCENK